MKTTIVFTDDWHADKRAVMTVEKCGQISLEFFPACGEDDTETCSYAHLARLMLDTVLAKKP
ncbi:MAG: hypothetical protein LBJ63_06725 [Prevotellaceae bacterium]|jgi:hypothetical protein|nr:hypothetical protein [Prevotellaceae bacterium]